MVRVPSAARKDRESDEQKKKERYSAEMAQIKLTQHLVEQVAGSPAIGRPPRSDEEKRETFVKLAYYRAAKLTYEECARRLDVSASTIRNWLADPLYKEIQQDLQEEGRADGFTSVSSLVQKAVATLSALLESAQSEFVRYKAAEEILKLAGMEQEQGLFMAEKQDDVARIIEAIRLRETSPSSGAPSNLHVQISVSGPNSGMHIVDALADPGESEEEDEATQSLESLISGREQRSLALQQQAMRREYDQPMLPGGKIPASAHPQSASHADN